MPQTNRAVESHPGNRATVYPVTNDRLSGAVPSSTDFENQSAVLQAAGLVVAGSVALQLSNSLASTMFAAYGAPQVSAMRMLMAAVMLLIAVRPRLTGRSRAEWVGILVYGATMAAMNMCLYLAIERIPLGVAATIEFLGPCAVALAASRRLREAMCAVLAMVGVALISAGPSGYFDARGYFFAACAAAAFGMYTVFAPLVGKAGNGLDGLTLSVTFAAIFTSPIAIPPLAGQVAGPDYALLAVSALLGVVITYGADTLAGRITSARVVGTLFAIDPAMGAIVGKLVLGQSLSLAAAVGVLAVVAAGALLVCSAESVSEPSLD